MSEPDQDLGMYGEFTERRARGADIKQALRIKIAESLGWRQLAGHDWIAPGEPLQSEFSQELPDFTGDANTALQLVEVLAKEGWEWEAYSYGEGVVFAFIMHEARFEATAPTLPEAICLAYCAVKSIPTDK